MKRLFIALSHILELLRKPFIPVIGADKIDSQVRRYFIREVWVYAGILRRKFLYWRLHHIVVSPEVISFWVVSDLVVYDSDVKKQIESDVSIWMQRYCDIEHRSLQMPVTKAWKHAFYINIHRLDPRRSVP